MTKVILYTYEWFFREDKYHFGVALAEIKRPYKVEEYSLATKSWGEIYNSETGIYRGLGSPRIRIVFDNLNDQFAYKRIKNILKEWIRANGLVLEKDNLSLEEEQKFLDSGGPYRNWVQVVFYNPNAKEIDNDGRAVELTPA